MTHAYTWKGKTPVKKGAKVDLLIDGKIWATAKVVDTLGSQFTCHVVGHPKMIRFFFYADKGVTWQPVEE